MFCSDSKGFLSFALGPAFVRCDLSFVHELKMPLSYRLPALTEDWVEDEWGNITLVERHDPILPPCSSISPTFGPHSISDANSTSQANEPMTNRVSVLSALYLIGKCLLAFLIGVAAMCVLYRTFHPSQSSHSFQVSKPGTVKVSAQDALDALQDRTLPYREQIIQLVDNGLGNYTNSIACMQHLDTHITSTQRGFFRRRTRPVLQQARHHTTTIIEFLDIAQRNFDDAESQVHQALAKLSAVNASALAQAKHPVAALLMPGTGEGVQEHRTKYATRARWLCSYNNATRGLGESANALDAELRIYRRFGSGLDRAEGQTMQDPSDNKDGYDLRALFVDARDST